MVALAHRRVLLVRQPRSGLLALPGGHIEAGESARDAAARELAEETGIHVHPEALADLGLVLEVADGLTLRPFAALEVPPPSAPAELETRWMALDALAGTPLAAGVARSVHATLALAKTSQAPPAELLDWWAGQADAFPWRATRDPYAVLVCEVMSQQTQIERVRERWERWIERWPTVDALAAAAPGEVLRAWDGLGYPRRARDLHECARRIAREGWPARLTDLPGVGPYTADAIRCFAFEEAVLPHDANVRRVLARRFPGGLAGASWSLGGALMDVGRTHCRARPRCAECPLARGCLVALEPVWDPAERPRRQAPYAGSLRARRGALLRSALAGERPAPARDPDAARTLVADGLLALRDGVLVEPAAIAPGERWSS